MEKYKIEEALFRIRDPLGWRNKVEPFDYHSPVGFFILLNWAKQQDWWNDFITEFIKNNVSTGSVRGFIRKFANDCIDPEAFPGMILNYLQKREVSE
jgi:hypothetical protein